MSGGSSAAYCLRADRTSRTLPGAIKGSATFKDLQFDARVSRPDPRFANLLLEQFGGGNGELKAAMQYFVQAFGCRRAYPDKYDLLMDAATEEFSHLEIVGATITMLLDGVNGEIKEAAEGSLVAQIGNGSAKPPFGASQVVG